MLIVGACSTPSIGASDSIKKQSTEEFGTVVLMPKYEEYPITSVEIISPLLITKKI